MSDDLVRRHLFGLEFVDAADIDDVVEVLTGPRPAGTLPLIVTPNVDHLVQMDHDPDGHAPRLARRAWLVLPDGQPIVWFSRLVGRPLSARLPGSTLVDRMVPALLDAGRPVHILCHSDRLAEALSERWPAAPLTTSVAGMITDGEAADACAREAIDVVVPAGAEFLFLTLSHGKQEAIIDGIIRQWPADRPMPLISGVGQSFDMYLGMVRRAPTWMQRVGLEWFFRFLQEPRRLFRRYFVDDVRFVAIAWREYRAIRGDAVVRPTPSDTVS